MTNLVDITVRVKDDASAELDSIALKLDEFGSKSESAHISVSGAGEAATELELLDTANKGASESSGLLTKATEALKSPMGALIGLGVALSPVIVTTGVGLGLFGAAAYAAAKPIIAASEASGGLKANLDTLDPAQQQVARGIISLQGDYDSFVKSMQPEVFSAFNSGLGIAKTLLKDAAPVAHAAGGAFDQVLQALGQDLQTSQWTSFFQFMAETAGPDVKQLGGFVIALANDLPQLLEQLQPVAQGLLVLGTDAAKAAGDLETLQQIGDKTSGSNDSVGLSLSGIESAAKRAGEQLVNNLIPGFSQTQKLVQTVEPDLDKLSGTTKKAGDNAQAAAPQVGTLAGDIAILSSNTSTASSDMSALNDEWSIFVGKSASDQQAVLNVSSAFDSYNQTVKTSGSRSDAAQSAFLGIITAMGSGLSTLEQNGASVSQLNSYYQTNINRLNTLHGLTPQQKQDIEGLTRDYTAWASSAQGLGKQLLTASGTIQNNFLSQLKTLHIDAPQAKNDADALADAILKTGTQSSASKADRAQLIKDLENAGASAKTATGLVNDLTGALNHIPKTTSAWVNLLGEGSGGIELRTSGPTSELEKIEFSALSRGGLLDGFGGGDQIPALLEPGETVVDKDRTKRFASVLRGMGVPGFASGGVAGLTAGIPGIVSSANSDAWGMAARATASIEHAFASGVMSAAQMAAKAAAVSGGISSAGVSNASAEMALASAANKMGWGGSQWAALFDVEMREAGFSLTATNPSSGAYGMAQFINGPSEYAQYGGNSTTAAGQATAMVNYVKDRYGNPENAWAHELAYGWYDNGGWLKPGWTMAYNGTGSPEPVGAAAAGGGTVHLEVSSSGSSAFEQFMVTAMRNWVRTKGGGSVQKAFGYGSG